MLQTAHIGLLLSSRGRLDVQGQTGQQVFGFCQLLYGDPIVWTVAQVTLEALVRLRQEIGGTDEIARRM